MRDRKVIDAEFVVVQAPKRREPILQPFWLRKLLAMLTVLGIGTLLLLRANGDWPFG
jgi:hypothetical protein